MPAAPAVGDFEAERFWLFVLALAEGYVDGGVGGMQPSARDEIQRASCGCANTGCVWAEVDFDVMLVRDALVLATAEGVQIAAVESAESVGDVVAVVIDCVGDGMRCLGRGDCQLDGRYDEAFVGEDLGALRVVDRHQLEPVVVIGFPEFAGDA